MSSSTPLASQLASVIPEGVTVNVYHISTPPHPVSAIYAAAPGKLEEKTFCETHYLAIAAPAREDIDEILVFAIEVLIFTTKTSTTIFVSKADSTGFTSQLQLPDGSPSIVSSVSIAFLDYLVRPRLDGNRLVVSLFARSQNQYLFPGSIENTTKHVLDDRQLIKWWCRVFDGVFRNGERDELNGDRFSTSTAHLVVPGCEKGETRLFFPRSSRADPATNQRWLNSYPLHLLVDHPTEPPRCLIPRLPDDPKSRFLDDLDAEHVDDSGAWRSVKTLEQFWELMSYRQECSAGRLVGFLWLVFPPKHAPEPTSSSTESQVDDVESHLPTPGQSQVERSIINAILPSSNGISGHENILLSPPSSSPTLPIHEASAVTELPSVEPTLPRETEQAEIPPERTVGSKASLDECDPPRWPEITRGAVIISAEEYQKSFDRLLELDFAGISEASKSTNTWITGIKRLNQGEPWGQTITGHHANTPSMPVAGDGVPIVNVLSGLRKKRKAEDRSDSSAPVRPADLAANVLSMGLIRKKPKP